MLPRTSRNHQGTPLTLSNTLRALTLLQGKLHPGILKASLDEDTHTSPTFPATARSRNDSRNATEYFYFLWWELKVFPGEGGYTILYSVNFPKVYTAESFYYVYLFSGLVVFDKKNSS